MTNDTTDTTDTTDRPVAHVWVTRMSRRYAHGLGYEVSCDVPADGTLVARFQRPDDADGFARTTARRLAEEYGGWVRASLTGGVVVRVDATSDDGGVRFRRDGVDVTGEPSSIPWTIEEPVTTDDPVGTIVLDVNDDEEPGATICDRLTDGLGVRWEGPVAAADGITFQWAAYRFTGPLPRLRTFLNRYHGVADDVTDDGDVEELLRSVALVDPKVTSIRDRTVRVGDLVDWINGKATAAIGSRDGTEGAVRSYHQGALDAYSTTALWVVEAVAR